MHCLGKSIMEHNEILGMDAALKFINQEHCQSINQKFYKSINQLKSNLTCIAYAGVPCQK